MRVQSAQRHGANSKQIPRDLARVVVAGGSFSLPATCNDSFSLPATCSGSVSADLPELCNSVGAPDYLKYATIGVQVNGTPCKALIDSGSSRSYMHLAFAKDLKLKILPRKSMVTLANTDSKSKVLGTCRIKINTESKTYENVEVGIFENLCCDLLLGGDFLQLHKKVIFEFSEKGNELTISKSNCNALTRAKVDTPSYLQI